LTTVATVVPFVFDRARWAELIERVPGKTNAEKGYLLGVAKETVSGWRNLRPNAPFEYPSMTNFLNVVNLMDANAADFFKLDWAE